MWRQKVNKINNRTIENMDFGPMCFSLLFTLRQFVFFAALHSLYIFFGFQFNHRHMHTHSKCMCTVSIKNCFYWSFLVFLFSSYSCNLPILHLHARIHNYIELNRFYDRFVRWVSATLDLISQYQTLLQSVKPVNREYSNFNQNEICSGVHNYFMLGVPNSLWNDSRDWRFDNTWGMY